MPGNQNPAIGRHILSFFFVLLLTSEVLVPFSCNNRPMMTSAPVAILRTRGGWPCCPQNPHLLFPAWSQAVWAASGPHVAWQCPQRRGERGFAVWKEWGPRDIYFSGTLVMSCQQRIVRQVCSYQQPGVIFGPSDSWARRNPC